jgi:hypothetical protein
VETRDVKIVSLYRNLCFILVTQTYFCQTLKSFDNVLNKLLLCSGEKKMKRMGLALITGCFLVGTTLADYPAIGFTVYRTADVKEILSTNGVVGLAGTNLTDKVVAGGYTQPGSSVFFRTASFQVRIKLDALPISQQDTGQYNYSLHWYDQKEKRAVFGFRRAGRRASSQSSSRLRT